MDYKNLKLKLDRRCIDFIGVVKFSTTMPEFAKELDRLLPGFHIMKVAQATGINKMIDVATGFAEAECEKYVALVWYLVWIRASPELRYTSPEIEAGLKKKYQPIIDELFRD